MDTVSSLHWRLPLEPSMTMSLRLV
jgi:hypothetical protein